MSIVYIFRRHRLKIKKKYCTSFSEDGFVLANCADPDEMRPYAAFHQGLQCAKVPD